MKNLLEELKGVIAENVPVDRGAICLNSNFENDLGVTDRIAFSVDVIAATEENFGISISEELVNEVETVDDLLIVVECEIEKHRKIMRGCVNQEFFESLNRGNKRGGSC